MKRKIVYLINPISGTKGKSSLKETISAATAAQKIDFEIIPTNAEGDYDFLKKRILNEKITDVVVCGGDGSVSTVSAALMGVDVNMGIIPLGSGNGLALCAGIPRNIPKALELVFKGRAAYVDGFYINKVFSCMLCGLGFDAQVAHEFAKQKKRGLASYVKISARQFFACKPYPFEIVTDKQRFSTDAYFISIANSNQFGNNFKIAPGASLSDGLLDIVVVKKMNKMMLPFSLFQQVTGFNGQHDLDKEVGNKNVIYFQTAELSILNTGGAPLHIDGDPAESSEEFDIKLVRNAIRLIQL